MANEKKLNTEPTKKKWYSVATEKIKWFFTEVMNMYSANDSYFSKISN